MFSRSITMFNLILKEKEFLKKLEPHTEYYIVQYQLLNKNIANGYLWLFKCAYFKFYENVHSALMLLKICFWLMTKSGLKVWLGKLRRLHIKLGVAKNVVKARDKENRAFVYLETIFPNLSSAKIGEWGLDGTQVRKLLLNFNFENWLSLNEKTAQNSFRQSVINTQPTKKKFAIGEVGVALPLQRHYRFLYIWGKYYGTTSNFFSRRMD